MTFGMEQHKEFVDSAIARRRERAAISMNKRDRELAKCKQLQADIDAMQLNNSSLTEMERRILQRQLSEKIRGGKCGYNVGAGMKTVRSEM